MMKKFLSSLIIFTLIICSCSAALCADQSKYIVLDVEGEGRNRDEAIESAWLAGIRQAVGSFIDSKTELNNDQLTERIISYSRGLVEKYEITSVDDSRASEGIYRVKMKLHIVQDKLRDGAKHASSGSAVIAFSPADIRREREELDAKAARALEAKNAAEQTAKTKSQTAAELLEAMLNRYKPEDFLSCYIPGKPEPVKGKTDVFNLNVELNFNDKLYSESFIPDLIQVLDQIASVKKNTLLVKYKEQLRKLAGKKEALAASDNSSIIMQANSDKLGKDYSVAVYNRPQNFGCRLYDFAKDDKDKILSYSAGGFAKFYGRTQRIKGLLLELIDEDKEVIETIEKRFDIAFLLTKDSSITNYNNKNARYTWSIQPTIMIIDKPSDHFSTLIPSGGAISVTGLSGGIVTDNKNLSIKIFSDSIHSFGGSIPQNSRINERDSYFPFTISPAVSFIGGWSSLSRSNYKYEFNASLLSPLQPDTTYTVTIKSNRDLPSLISGKSFKFRTNSGWQEKKQFIIPVEIEMPEEVLPVVKNIKVSLLIK